MDRPFEVGVVQGRVVGLEGGEDVLDAERAVHFREIDHLLAEGFDQVDDVVADVQQVSAEIRIGIGQFLQAATFEALVVGRSTNTLRDIPAQLFCQGSARIMDRIAQEFGML